MCPQSSQETLPRPWLCCGRCHGRPDPRTHCLLSSSEQPLSFLSSIRSLWDTSDHQGELLPADSNARLHLPASLSGIAAAMRWPRFRSGVSYTLTPEHAVGCEVRSNALLLPTIPSRRGGRAKPADYVGTCTKTARVRIRQPNCCRGRGIQAQDESTDGKGAKKLSNGAEHLTRPDWKEISLIVMSEVVSLPSSPRTRTFAFS